MLSQAPPQNALAVICDEYLAARTATFEQRCQRYSNALAVIQDNGRLTNDDILLDFGAGGTDLDAYLRQSFGWRGRYWPVDGWMGFDLQWWEPKRQVAWVVALEVIEHLPKHIAMQVLQRFKIWATKGVVISTPNALTVDVIAMDSTHEWGARMGDLTGAGYDVEVASLYGQVDDSLVAWWSRG